MCSFVSSFHRHKLERAKGRRVYPKAVASLSSRHLPPSRRRRSHSPATSYCHSYTSGMVSLSGSFVICLVGLRSHSQASSDIYLPHFLVWYLTLSLYPSDPLLNTPNHLPIFFSVQCVCMWVWKSLQAVIWDDLVIFTDDQNHFHWAKRINTLSMPSQWFGVVRF